METKNLVDSFIAALSDNTVKKMIGDIFEQRLTTALLEIERLKRESGEQRIVIESLTENLSQAHRKIDELETYTRRNNLVISGLPLASYAEASSPTDSSSEHLEQTEQNVLAICQQLQVNISPADISIAHRLKRKPYTKGPPAVMVQFKNRKAREAVYAARFKLKERRDVAIFINEDLTKHNAEIFAQARQLVKVKKIFSTWTKAGIVYIKATQTSRPTSVYHINELVSY